MLPSLNHYSNGICSMRHHYEVRISQLSPGLNPYSNGICSMSDYAGMDNLDVLQS